MNKSPSFTKVPVIADINLQITFSEAILDAKSLRMNQPIGWEEKLLKIKERQREIWIGIHSGGIEIACWSEPYSDEERRSELIELYKTRDLENSFERDIDYEDEMDILDYIETLLGN